MTVTKLSVPLKEALGYINEGTTVPANTNTDGTALEVGQTNGQIEIILEAKTDVFMKDTKTLTFVLSASATSGGTYVAFHTKAILMIADITYPAGTILDSVVIPLSDNLYIQNFINANVTTDDTLATGTYSVYIRRVVN